MNICSLYLQIIMARPKNNRIVQQPPKVKGFNPMGYYSANAEKVILDIEEYECIRLLDYENLSQEEASKFLNVSRPTLTRIYDSARKKIAKMLIMANQLVIDGGNYVFRETWFECKSCCCKFNNPTNKEICKCALCGNKEITKLKTGT